MAVDAVVEKEYHEFIENVNRLRCEALRRGEQFTDKSLLDLPFMGTYEQLIGRVKPTPSVTEYGGGVPVVSLFFLQRKTIGRLTVIDDDLKVLRQLERVVKGLKLSVEILDRDITKLTSYPETDVGVSFNALYGPCPTPEQAFGLFIPKLTEPVISGSCHDGFAVFRHMNGFAPWEEGAIAEIEMQRQYDHIDTGYQKHTSAIRGFRKLNGGIAQAEQSSQAALYYIVGWNTKTL